MYDVLYACNVDRRAGGCLEHDGEEKQESDMIDGPSFLYFHPGF